VLFPYQPKQIKFSTVSGNLSIKGINLRIGTDLSSQIKKKIDLMQQKVSIIAPH